MRSCAAKGCTSVATASVLTRGAGRLDVCATHADVLSTAGEVLTEAPALIGLVVDPDAHKRKIREGIDRARERGTHVGRPPVVVPPEAVEAVRNGEPARTVARRFRVAKETLKRRAAAPAAPAPTAPRPPDAGDAITAAGRMLTDAAKLLARGEAEVRAGEEKIRDAREMARRARDLLGSLGPSESA